jgi:hypothetical protein
MADATPTPHLPTAVPDWRASLPDGLREAEALSRFDDVAALAREHVHLQALIGRKGIIPPGDDATPEERAAFFTALGRPATPDEYDLEGFAPPAGLPWNADIQASMLREMHAAGLNNSQARSLINAYADMQESAFDAVATRQAANAERALSGLQAEWGERFEARLDLAGRAFRATFGEAFDDVAGLALADGGRVGDHPEFVRAFATLGERMAEPELVGAGATSREPSGEAARFNLRALEADPDFRAALLDRNHPDHRAAIAKRSMLTSAAYAGRDSDET